ncbi:MAG: methionine biosynthesis protein MetW [Alphaproteobacteria bacterium]|nr:methionine biosynthesis protein MetW [Alphaproteobacteria bacterium]
MSDRVGGLRSDLAAIAALIPENARLLDVGCGTGELLEHLRNTKHIDGRGLELSQSEVNACVARGLPVVQGDADTDLADYPSGVFDVVILSDTIQSTRSPKTVLQQLLRIGRRIVVSLPNFGHWRVRMALLATGRMPRTSSLNYAWYETPNIHLCTIADFVQLARDEGAMIERAYALQGDGRTIAMRPDAWGPNLFAERAIFLLRGNTAGG